MRSSAPARREARSGLIFISPWLLGFSVFWLWPLGYSLYLSFTDYNLAQTAKFVGVANYAHMFFEDFTFWHSLRVTTVLVGLYVPLSVVGSLLLAVLTNREVRGMRTFRAAYFLPSMIPMVAAVMLWLWIFSPRFGLLNFYLRSLGLPTSEWIASPRTVTLSVIVFLLWLSVGGPRMMIFLAGLKDIPVELYEVARIDGAGPLHQFLKVTLPLLSPVLFLNLVIAIIYTFQVFVVAYSLTQGGPLNMTLYYILYLYRNAFQFLKIGYASAIAWFFFIVILAITAGQFWLSRRWVHFERE